MSWTQIRKYFWKPFKFSQNLDLSGWNPDKNVHKSCLSMLFIGRQAKISFTPWVLFPPRINSTCFRALWFGEHLPSSRYARGLSWWYTRGKCRICGGIPLRWHVRQLRRHRTRWALRENSLLESWWPWISCISGFQAIFADYFANHQLYAIAMFKRGHRGKYCQEFCDPWKVKELEGVNTPVCEQVNGSSVSDNDI